MNHDNLRTPDVFLLWRCLFGACGLLDVDHELCFSFVLVDGSGGVMDVFTIVKRLACATACVPVRQYMINSRNTVLVSKAYILRAKLERLRQVKQLIDRGKLTFQVCFGRWQS